MKKIIKLTEADLARIVKRVIREQSNDVASSMTSTEIPKKSVSKKMPTDYNKSITFLFPDNTSLVIQPAKQDVSKNLILTLGKDKELTNNVINLTNTSVSKKVCDNRRVYIFTKPIGNLDNWCSLSNIKPDYLKNNGIFEIINKPEFITMGTFRGSTQG